MGLQRRVEPAASLFTTPPRTHGPGHTTALFANAAGGAVSRLMQVTTSPTEPGSKTKPVPAVDRHRLLGLLKQGDELGLSTLIVRRHPCPGGLLDRDTGRDRMGSGNTC